MKDYTRKILVLDDEPMLINILVEILQSNQIECKSTSTMKQALDIINKEEISAIFSDISMPDGTGIDFLTTLRAQNINIPLVFLTAHDDKAYMMKAIQLGAIDYIEKPFDPARVVSVADRMLEIGARLRKISATKTSEATKRDEKFISQLRATNSRKSG
jgi:two-component system nitrogen regulation response regulator GlnG